MLPPSLDVVKMWYIHDNRYKLFIVYQILRTPNLKMVGGNKYDTGC